jgi:hypothetical protein
MSRPALEVADIFRDHGSAWRSANAGHVSLDQLKVMSAIERCRTAALGGHVARCEKCSHTVIAYNSCRNRHCPKCQGAAAKQWLAEREAELLPVPYFHRGVHVPGAGRRHRLPEQGRDLRSVVQGCGRHHTHHRRRSQASGRQDRHHRRAPYLGLGHDTPSASAHDRARRRPVARLFRRLFLKKLKAAHAASRLCFYGEHSPLAEREAFTAYLRPLRKIEWVVYAKRPFGGPETVLAYLSRYTHRVAIANHRLIAADANTVSFRYKDYRNDGPARYKVMTLATGEFIRRFLMHVLPKGFHRIRHYGLFAKPSRADNIARARQLLAVSQAHDESVGGHATNPEEAPINRCPCCGGRMIIIETFERGCQPKNAPAAIRIDTS